VDVRDLTVLSGLPRDPAAVLPLGVGLLSLPRALSPRHVPACHASCNSSVCLMLVPDLRQGAWIAQGSNISYHPPALAE
jgi:hypothetical protein